MNNSLRGVCLTSAFYQLKRAMPLAIFGLLLLTSANINVPAQAPGTVDTTFTGGVMSPYAVGENYQGVEAIAIQPDGKHIIAGFFRWVNSTGRNYIARLNEDGTLDTTFSTGVGFNVFVKAIAIQPDGKILVGGRFWTFTDFTGTEVTRWKIARLNSNGSLDTTFNAGIISGTDVNAILLQPDGKIVIGGDFNFTNNVARVGIARLNSDGSLDNSFAPAPGINTGSSVVAITQQPDGKILIGGAFSTYNGVTRNGVARINTDGSLDSTFDPAAGAAAGLVRAIALQSDGKIIVGGGFQQFNNNLVRHIARLNSNGSRDTTFIEGNNCGGAPGSSPNCNISVVGQITVLSDGKILVSANGHTVNSGGNILYGGNTVRFNANGSLDTVFASTQSIGFGPITSLGRHAIQADGKIVTNTPRSIYHIQTGANASTYMVRHSADGNFDSTYTPMLEGGAPGKHVVTDILREPDGKLMVVGDFEIANNTPRPCLARFNGNGTLDTGFTGGTECVDAVHKVLRQPDGKYIIAGSLGRVNGVIKGGVARLNYDGSLDTTFNQQGTGADGIIYSTTLQPDGKILIGGGFGNYNGVARNGIARLNTDGTLDTSFNPGTGVPVNFSMGIYSIALQPDAKILIGGFFGSFNGTQRNHIARLNADGSLDTTFNPGAGINTNAVGGGVYDIKTLPDGRILIAGLFGSYNSVNRRNLARINSDGSLDATFGTTNQQFIDQAISKMHVQTNGKILIAGTFTSIGGQVRRGVARLNANGTLDASFSNGMFGADPTSSAAFGVPAVGLAVDEANSRLYFGSSFSTFNHIGRGSLVRLFTGNTLTNRTMFDYDGDGRADLSVFRPSSGSWFISQSSNNAFIGVQFGANGDLVAPADFDGDGKTDINVFRPSDGGWYRLNSSNNTFSPAQFGTNGDLPVPGDFDGDGKADLTVFRPSTGSWYRINSSNNQFVAAQFGSNGDKPLVGDFDGDGKSDLTVFRPSNGTWYRINSSNDTFSPNQFGAPGDLPVAADYDGDGKTDLAVYRSSVGDWYIVNSSNNSFTGLRFGINEDKPAPADFDGDGKADLVVFRPSNGTWYLLRSNAGFTGFQFGANGDVPTPNAFVR